MTSFTIEANDFLSVEIQGYSHTDFGGPTFPGNPNYLYKLKNDPQHSWTGQEIRLAQNTLSEILMVELPIIYDRIGHNPLTVCCVPRAKSENSYSQDQQLFRETVRNVVNQIDNFIDGTNYIRRHTNTKTTHLRRPMEGYNNDGCEPYPGIASDTCNFSPEINNKNILLVDDIYTRTVNIDEDMIQSLLHSGANSVTFYAIGNTVARN